MRGKALRALAPVKLFFCFDRHCTNRPKFAPFWKRPFGQLIVSTLGRLLQLWVDGSVLATGILGSSIRIATRRLPSRSSLTNDYPGYQCRLRDDVGRATSGCAGLARSTSVGDAVPVQCDAGGSSVRHWDRAGWATQTNAGRHAGSTGPFR